MVYCFLHRKKTCVRNCRQYRFTRRQV
jgi:hypothetical protein